MLKFDEKTHQYTLGGKIIPSVTQILNRVGTRNDENSPWQSVSGGDFMINEIASKFGKEFHKAAAARVMNKKFTCDPLIKPWVNGLEMFLSEYDVWNCEAEIMHFSKYGFAGTYDVFSNYSHKNRSGLCVLDWKTSVTISKSSRLQTAGYEQITREKHNIRKNIHIDRLTIRIFENGYEVDLRTKKDSSDWTKFLSILNVYKTYSKAAS